MLNIKVMWINVLEKKSNCQYIVHLIHIENAQKKNEFLNFLLILFLIR